MSIYAKLREDQKRAVDRNLDLIEKSVEGTMSLEGRQVTVAPTGSGKTFMMAAIIE